VLATDIQPPVANFVARWEMTRKVSISACARKSARADSVISKLPGVVTTTFIVGCGTLLSKKAVNATFEVV
jgi:hypothetical protein